MNDFDDLMAANRDFAASFDLGGFDVRHLGASVPTDSLLQMVAAERPRMVSMAGAPSSKECHSTRRRPSLTFFPPAGPIALMKPP